MVLGQESAEKRSNLRFLARITIYYGTLPEELLSDYSINISPGGTFIESHVILPVETVLTVRFNLPGLAAPIYTHARVAWVNPPEAKKKESFPPGMGLQFLSLSAEDAQAISTFLESGNFAPTR